MVFQSFREKVLKSGANHETNENNTTSRSGSGSTNSLSDSLLLVSVFVVLRRVVLKLSYIVNDKFLPR
jgi:hypothetical protein